MRAPTLLLLTVLMNLEAQQGNAQVRRGPLVMPAGKSSIDGRVVNHVTGEPVRRARVTLSGLTAVTDASGHFAFKQLPAGSFFVQGQASGFPVAPLKIGISSAQITLAADEHKAELTLSLVPGASISGHVADEEGSPMADCQVSAMQFDSTQGAKKISVRSGVISNQKGEYRITNLAAGRYYVLARCHGELPLPHGLIRRGSDVEIPRQAYAPIFYPGADLAGATRIVATAGADAGGIDFRLSPAAGVTVHGHVTAPPLEGMSPTIQLMFAPQDRLIGDWLQIGAHFDPQSGNFHAQHVLPGSYQIIASTAGTGDLYYARTPVSIGAAAPEPVQIMLVRVSPLSGTISIDGDMKAPFENVRVLLQPLEIQFGNRPPDVQVLKDGSFTLSVLPGRWRLQVIGLAGYMKSVSLNDKEIPPFILDLTAGSAGPLKIVMGTKGAEMDGTVTGASPGGGEVSGLLWPADEEMYVAGLDRIFRTDSQGRFRLPGMTPGHYYGCAMAIPQPWELMRDIALLNAIKSRCAKLELVEGGRTSAEIPFLSARDLERLAEDADLSQTR